MKNKKITAEEQDTYKLGKLFSERKASGRKVLTISEYVYHQADTNVHYVPSYVRATGIEISMILPP